jgi:hypothetical protein
MAGCSPDREGQAELKELEKEAAAPAGSAADTQATGGAPAEPGKPFQTGVAERQGDSVATLNAVRVARHEGYERIVFEFGGAIPGYKVEYIDRPVRQCGSGEVVPLPGDAWLSMRFYPANAHSEEGKPTVSAGARDQDTSGSLTNLKRLKLICDFEAVTEFIGAVGMPGRFRVLELTQPYRVVVDIQVK